MHEMIKKMKLIIMMTIFILCFLLFFTVIYMKIPPNESKQSANEISSSGDEEEFNISDKFIKYSKDEDVIVDGDNTVKLYDEKNNKVIELNLEDYVVGVLAGEVPANFNEEALKAQAVAARTYYLAKRKNVCRIAKEHGAEICSTTHCQVYMSKEERFSKWSNSTADSNWNKIKDAVSSTAGQVLIYDNKLVENPKYFSVSAGKTENSVDVFSDDVPYLKSTDSPGEEEAPKYETSIQVKKNDFIKTVNSSYSNAKMDNNNINNISILSRTDGEGVKEIKLGNISISGVEFRKLFNLNSTDFNIKINTDSITIECKGYGHRVGMSQWGANAMAKDGKGYKDILKHYYTGVDMAKVKFNNN